MKDKEPLTEKYALDNNLTWNGIVRYFRPDWTDDQCDYYLWNETAFPFNSLEGTINELNNFFGKKQT